MLRNSNVFEKISLIQILFICWRNISNIITHKVKRSRYRPGVAERVGRGIALLFHDRGTRRGWVVSSTPRPHFTPGKDPVPIVKDAGWVPGPVWTGAENLVPTWIRSRTVQPVASRYTDWPYWSVRKQFHSLKHSVNFHFPNPTFFQLQSWILYTL